MDFSFTPAELEFVDEVRTWLSEHMVGEFASLSGRGLTGHDDVDPELQIAWERELAADPRWEQLANDARLDEPLLFAEDATAARDAALAVIDDRLTELAPRIAELDVRLGDDPGSRVARAEEHVCEGLLGVRGPQDGAHQPGLQGGPRQPDGQGRGSKGSVPMWSLGSRKSASGSK